MNYVKYKRFEKEFNMLSNDEYQKDIQDFLDSLIVEGWNIISYIEYADEETHNVQKTTSLLTIIILAGKTSHQIKNVL